MNTTNGTTRAQERTQDRRVTIEIVRKVTATRPGPPRGETGSYTAILNGQEIATRTFDGGWRKKAAARTALFAMLDAIEELH